MAKFVFLMQSLLSLKNRIEDQKKQEFGKAMSKLEEEREILRKLNEDKQSVILVLKNGINTKIDPLDFQSYNNYIEFLKKKIVVQENVIIKAEKYVEEKRIELIEATKERKMLEKIKEKKYEEHIEEEKIQEQKIIDEIVSYKYSEL